MLQIHRRAVSDQEIIAMIYEAVLDEGIWPRALEAVTKRIGCDDVHFALYDRVHGRQLLSGMSVIPPTANAEYIENYFPSDKRVPKLLTARPLLLLDDRDLQSEEERAKNPFHQEFLPRYGITFQVLSTLITSECWFAVLVAGNSLSRGEFSAQQKRALGHLLPHLQRAIRLFLKNHTLSSRLRMANNAIDRLSFAVLVLAGDCTILNVNSAGRAMLREADGLRERRNQLWIEDERAFRGLRSFIRSVGNGDLSKSPSDDQFPAGRPSGRSPYHMYVHRLPQQVTVWSAEERAAILMFITDPNKAPRRLGTTLIHAYGLTGAEAGVAAAIANGKTIAQHADEKKLSVETIRFQMKQVMEKTGVNRQAEFIRLISRTFTHIAYD